MVKPGQQKTFKPVTSKNIYSSDRAITSYSLPLGFNINVGDDSKYLVKLEPNFNFLTIEVGDSPVIFCISVPSLDTDNLVLGEFIGKSRIIFNKNLSS